MYRCNSVKILQNNLKGRSLDSWNIRQADKKKNENNAKKNENNK